MPNSFIPTSTRRDVGGYLRRTGLTIGGFIALIWIVYVLTTLFPTAILAFGIQPRETEGLIGIPLHVFLHGNLAHLLHNSVGMLIFGTLLYLREERDFWIVSAIGVLLGGFGVWLLGSPAVHIGASTVLFAYFGYLVAVGLFERRIGSLILSLVLFIGWGSVLLGVLPNQNGISWEGHLFGLGAGILAARLLARRRSAGSLVPTRVVQR